MPVARILMALFICLFAHNATAEKPAVAMIETYFDALKSNGDVSACSLVYTAALMDNHYEIGRPLILNGNVTYSLILEKQITSLTFKLGVVDGRKDISRLDLGGIYLEAAGQTYKPSVAFDSDVVGYKVAAYDLESSLNILSYIFKNQLSMGFNFSGGHTDLGGNFDFTIKKNDLSKTPIQVQYSQEMLQQFMQCALSLNDKLRTTLQHQ